MNFAFRRHRSTLRDSMKTTTVFPTEGHMLSFLDTLNLGKITLEHYDEPDERTGWSNEGYVLSDGYCIGMYGEIADVNDQQRIIAYLAGKLAEIASVNADKPVTPADIIELAERNVHK